MRRRKLDAEMRPFRQAAREKNPTNDLLRTIRQSMRIPLTEIAEKMGVCNSVVQGIEERELTNTATIGSIARVAKAMGFKVVYGIVPEDGKTLEELTEELFWAGVLGVSKIASQQAKIASQQVSEPASQQASESEGQQVSESASQQVGE